MLNHETKTPKPRKRRKIGTLRQCRTRLWAAIERTSAIVETESDPETVLRAVHALSQAVAAYVRLTDAHTNEPLNEAVAKKLTSNLRENS
jgi:hypothetical protein